MHKRTLQAGAAILVAASVVRAQDSAPGPQAKDTLRVGIVEAAPFESVAPSGPSSGFAIDVVTAVARRASFETRFETLPSDEAAEAALRNGAVDVLPNMGIVASRDSSMDFSHPVYTSRVRIFVRTGAPGLRDASDLAGRRVATVRTGSGYGGTSRISGALDTVYTSVEAALSALIAGRVDAMTYPEHQLWNLAAELGLRDLVESTGAPVVEVPRGLAVREGNAALLARLNPAVDALLADHEYTEIVRRWFVEPPPFWTVTRLLTWTALVLLLLGAAHYVRVRHLNQRLVKSRDQLRALAGHLQTLREEEQKILARELHDEIGQAMVVLKMDLSELRDQDGDGLPGRYDELIAVADSAIQVGHRICTRLRPDILDHLGLRAALEWAAEDFELRAGMPCVLDVQGCDGEIDPETATAVFRIAQEALSNVIRHARADSVEIRLDLTGDPLHMEIEDDGRGATRAELDRPDALGVLGMKERAAGLGGTLTIRSRPGRGAVVAVDVPRVPSVAALA